MNLKEEAIFSEKRNLIEDKSKNQDLIYGFTSFGVIILFQLVVFIVFKLFSFISIYGSTLLTAGPARGDRRDHRSECRAA